MERPAVVIHVRHARGFLQRARGLLGRPMVAPGCGLLLDGVNAVHGCGMRRAIDLVFLDERGIVVHCQRLQPWRAARCAAASHVLEMREGEATRLGIRPGDRPELPPAGDIFRRSSGRQDKFNDAGEGRYAAMPPLPRPRTRWLPWLSLATGLLLQDASAAPSGSDPLRALPGLAIPPTSPVPGRAAAVSAWHLPAIDAATLRRFEAEADELYRDSGPREADAELLNLYEALAAAAPQRRAHAWLRIGNIHQRAGTVGAAMDAYRKALDEAVADARQDGATESRRKALLNLAALALEEARRALSGLSPLPAASEHFEPLEALSRQLERAGSEEPPVWQAAASPPRTASPSASMPASRDAPYVVERYTASGRRNAVKAAKGSLHVDPDDELPARPVAKPRRRARERLPDVEYLLGDPLRWRVPVEADGNGRKRTKEVDAGAQAAPPRTAHKTSATADLGMPGIAGARR